MYTVHVLQSFGCADALDSHLLASDLLFLRLIPQDIPFMTSIVQRIPANFFSPSSRKRNPLTQMNLLPKLTTSWHCRFSSAGVRGDLL
jgi:hypothetical protein